MKAEGRKQKAESRRMTTFCLLLSALCLPKGGEQMKKILTALAAWLVAITGLHLWLNVNWAVLLNDRLPESQRKLNVAYIPVT